jgi:hypothetical protein
MNGTGEPMDVRNVEPPEAKDLVRLWLGFLLPPLGWVFDLAVSYGLTSTVCETGKTYLLALTTAGALVLVAGGLVLSLASRRRLGRGQPAPEEERSRFFVAGGIANAGFFTLAIFATAIGKVMLGVCP